MWPSKGTDREGHTPSETRAASSSGASAGAQAGLRSRQETRGGPGTWGQDGAWPLLSRPLMPLRGPSQQSHRPVCPQVCRLPLPRLPLPGHPGF